MGLHGTHLRAGGWPLKGSSNRAPVGGQNRAGNHACGGTCKKDHGIRYSARLGVAPQRRLAALKIGCLSIRRICIRIGRTGLHEIHGDAARAELARKAASEGRQCRLDIA